MAMTLRRALGTAAWVAALTLPVQAAPAAHEHGVARLSVAVDGRTLSVELDAPLDGLLGFERPPRTDAERKAAADLLQRLRDPAALFRPDAAAGCSAGAVTVSAPGAVGAVTSVLVATPEMVASKKASVSFATA